MKACRLFCFSFVLFACFLSSTATELSVGGQQGWVLKPSEDYNHWAGRYRFQVNDNIVFKYEKGSDSVLLVNKVDYEKCNKKNPIKKMDDGNSVFKFDRSGPFYFISGEDDHCEKGQKLIVVVMAVRPYPTPKIPGPVPPMGSPASSPVHAPPKRPTPVTPFPAPPKGSMPISPSPSASSPVTMPPKGSTPSPPTSSPIATPPKGSAPISPSSSPVAAPPRGATPSSPLAPVKAPGPAGGYQGPAMSPKFPAPAGNAPVTAPPTASGPISPSPAAGSLGPAMSPTPTNVPSLAPSTGQGPAIAPIGSPVPSAASPSPVTSPPAPPMASPSQSPSPSAQSNAPAGGPAANETTPGQGQGGNKSSAWVATPSSFWVSAVTLLVSLAMAASQIIV